MRFALHYSILLAAFLSFFASIPAGSSYGDIVTLFDNTPSGTAAVNNANDYVGILDGITPNTIGGVQVNMPLAPIGEVFVVGDLVGRDMNAHSGSRVWTFDMALPSDAVPGTGLENIVFQSHAFERRNNNLENNDLITWELFLNGAATPVDSATSGGNDFDIINISLSDPNPGSSLITDAQVVFTISGFNGGGEWFAARHRFSATYTAIPEPVFSGLCLLLPALVAVYRKPRPVSR